MGIQSELERVFDREIETLVKVREGINGSYTQAVELLFQCSGKIVVTGMGKSGLIAQKIAATMISTGTPAYFLHPGDALHGDVGIIRDGDVLLAISKSGETDELLGILAYVKRAEVPIISITAAPKSTLINNSDLVLLTPVTEEACPLNLAPTSSTTAALVVGDALAMALMQLRGFEREHFALLHPGGQLGKRLLLMVADVMRSGENNPVVQINDTVPHLLDEMTRKMCGAVSVIDDQGQLLGLVTDYDIRSGLEQRLDIFSQNISGIMNANPTHVYSDEKAIRAFEIMESRDKPFIVLPVLDRLDNRVVGMVHIHDLISRGL